MSIATILHVSEYELLDTIESYDTARLRGSSEHPFLQMPRDVLSEFDTSIDAALQAFDGATYFHGTRSTDRTTFETEGILPLGHTLSSIWPHLRDLAAGDIADSEWAAFRTWLFSNLSDDSAHLYGLKAGDRMLWGPYGMLVRDALLHPGEAGIHDYLGGPEIIEDIADAFERRYEIPLLERYLEATTPCIVTFQHPTVGLDEICSAVWYLYSSTRDEPLVNVFQGSFCGGGIPVSASQVLSVDVITDPSIPTPRNRR